jgi:3',5'-nucleoside bisphosphate phosphatase
MPTMEERIDLHTHSNCSDGRLTPTELAAEAARRLVQLWALTDHDTIAGCAEAATAAAAHGVPFVPGIELSTQWRGRELHIVGLGLDTASARLQETLAALAAERARRIRAIGVRLEAAGLPGNSLAEELLASKASPTRMHLARRLAELGHVRDTEQAFEKWLGKGRKGAVPFEWPTLEATVATILAAGGLPVIAHPHRYKLSNGPLGELCAAFRALGGIGLEVSLAGHSPADAARAATLARRHGLAGSVGSDFHEPGLPWRPLGRFAKLPDGIEPIAARLIARPT